MYVIAKVNRWGELILLDGTLHDTARAGREHLLSKVGQLGEAVAADYQVYSLTPTNGAVSS